ncbi:MAG: hypothetical protein RI842_06030 [Schleiferiaceae bacterium]|nr:hypothetical protein [Schleiferiaceae bacterium]
MTKQLSTTILLLAGGFFLGGPGALVAQEFRLEWVYHDKVRELLSSQKVAKLEDFEQVAVQCYTVDSADVFWSHLRQYEIDVPVARAWQTYLGIAPEEAWKGGLVDFGLCYAPDEQKVYWPFEPFTGLREGQLHFMELNLLGLAEIAVGHQVVEVNAKAQRIGFCYLQEGESAGSQWIQLRAQGPQKTAVIHYTRYHSDSYFRDTKLYPLFHSLVIDRFHKNVRKQAEKLYRAEAMDPVAQE